MPCSTQLATSFLPGATYSVSLLTMARTANTGNDLELVLDLGLPTQQTILDIPEVTFTAFTEVESLPFVAMKDSYTLTLRSNLDNGNLSGDRATFVDALSFNVLALPLTPEPSTFLLGAVLLSGFGLRFWRKRKRA